MSLEVLRNAMTKMTISDGTREASLGSLPDELAEENGAPVDAPVDKPRIERASSCAS